MELSENVIQVLKNFATINSSIVIEPGNNLSTISEARNVLGSAVIDQEFPRGFGLYDLNEFLNVVGLVDSPRLRFEDTHVLVGDSTGRSTIKYFYTDTEMLTKPPATFNMPKPEIVIDLSNDVLNKVKRAASVLGHGEMVISSGNGCITLTIQDSENATSNTFSIDVPAKFDYERMFNFVLNIQNLKVLPGDYEVKISSKLISQFTSKDGTAEYHIALEKTSTYGE